MHSALTIVLGIAAACVSGIVGSFALMKRMTLAGDVVSHLALPGLGLAFLWGVHPMIGAAATLLIGLLVIDRLQRQRVVATDTAIGVVFVGALAIGALVTPREDLIDALFGGYGDVGIRVFAGGLLVCAVVAVTLYILRHQMILVIFSSDLATSLGIKVGRINLLYLLMFGLTILLGLRFLGALLVGAMIIVPAAAGRRVARTLDQFLLASSVVSVLSAGAGFACASRWHLPLGPTIVATASLFFALTFLRRPRGQRIASGVGELPLGG